MKTNKKPLIALAVLAMVGIVAGTIAYFTSEAVFPNVFKTKTYNTELTEEFKSPEDWTPGTITDKVVSAKNTGNIDLAVRVSYTEEWVAADETTKPSTTLPNGEQSVILHTPETEVGNWTEKQADGYYYYKKGLTNGQSATFIDYVTFNKNADVEYDEETTYTYTDAEGKNPVEVTVKKGEEMTEEDKASIGDRKLSKQVKSYTSKKDGYAGATYTLTIKVETVQYDKYTEAWKTDVEIAPAA